ncbi:MAG TPA: hypothetical protein DCX53_01875, partial [Anaerolineae bacterium]|nr:hypothetical protein [Anaerolineae bacterium]
DKWSVTIAARRVEQAKEFATSYPNNRLRITSFSDLQPSTPRQAQDSAYDLVVNTTPLGMSPNLNQSALPENLSLPQHVAIYDLVYNPSVTKLVRDARLQGLQATTGLGMLIEQAALSFEIWTGCNPPRKAISASVEQSPVSNL